MFYKSSLLLAVLLLAAPVIGQAQEPAFDGDAFAKEVNAEIKARKFEGVTVTGDPRQAAPMADYKWAKELTASPPQFGIVVLDKDKKPIDVLGGSAPYVVTGSEIAIAGYDLPAGGSFKTVGAAGWTKAVSELATEEASPPSEDIQKAVGVVADATDYIAGQLCKRKSHPTKIVFHLTAGFELVFNAETGSEVEWDLEIVCSRMEK
ncbi:MULTISPECIES: hypothetical protein [Rhizobium]|jgi:hypothetical protein|uniref:hypothetical protein n=1 Tax=Rhizobium TaxID=379 RepID=UPI001030CF8A|nr:hypothetical protein [Rhizobium leguminosarum]NEI66841.1 hypothetical protein [Rhizobium leguminosarum]QIO57308.1 hypothetical protein HA463_06140 [Rhizobium leguminosarum bv. trifolii]TAY35892.1 hypothetical protein ELH89_01390 [Rhizobium leguminosarum]